MIQKRAMRQSLALALCVLLCALSGCRTEPPVGDVQTLTEPGADLPADPPTEAPTEAEILLADCGAYYEDMARDAYSAVLYDLTANRQLFGKNTATRVAPASITKLLTASVAHKYLSFDTVCVVGSELELVGENSSVCQIAPGQELTVRDLVTGMLLASGNDAAYTIAVHVARAVTRDDALSDTAAVAAFCSLMNSLAAELKAGDSHFVTPDGWDSEEQYTTAGDVLRIAAHALSIAELAEIVALDRKDVVFASGESITWTNSNRLLQADSAYYLPSAIGMKTGTTDLAGRCLVAAATAANGHTLLAVVMNCPSDESRYETALRLLEPPEVVG